MPAVEEKGGLMRRLKAAVRKELLQFSRDWLLLGLIGYIYTIDVMLCTYALSFDVRNLNLAVYDQDRTPLSRELVERFTATDYFGRLLPVSAPTEIDRLLDGGKADLALMIPPDFSRLAGAGRAAEVQLLLSGVNSNTANAARGYAQIILQGFARNLLEVQAAARGVLPALPEVQPQLRIWYNPGLQFRLFMATSMLVVAALMVGVITSAAGLVREKETGTAEQLVVTPLRRHEIVVAKMVPPFVIGMLALLPGLAIARWFGVPLNGSLSLFFAASAATLIVCMAIGTFIATFVANLQQALLVAFFVLFPVMFLSGTIVPVESMPAAMQYLSLASPIRYYMEIALGTLLKGIGWGILWPKLVVLAVMSAVLLAWSLRRLRTRFYV
jgi:drug efflux transport system permease protein